MDKPKEEVNETVSIRTIRRTLYYYILIMFTSLLSMSRGIDGLIVFLNAMLFFMTGGMLFRLGKKYQKLRRNRGKEEP
jgi:hypothetical protein